MRIFRGILTFLIAATVILTSCSKGNEGTTFTVKGNISNGAGRSVGVYHVKPEGINRISETRLDASGNYSFNIASPKHFDFYLLDVDSCGAVIFIADSTETVTINSDANDFIAGHTIDGNSENLRIKEITILRAALEEQVRKMATNTSPAVVKTEREIRELVDEFKQNIIEQYIKPAFGSASAYYALTLTVGGSPIFNPMQNRDDSKWLAAVATNFQNTHPGTSHTAYLTEVAKKGLEATRQPRTVEIELEESEALTTGMFNINLPQPSGDSIALSSFVGKVVMLDFTFYESTEMGSRNILMRELHNKYRNKGFDIYQVSLDKNKDFWKQSAANLPWTCVHDTFGISAQLYNVEVLPTFFLIGKNGEVLLRDTQIEDIGKEIEKHLNK
jgi:peroxiredoxin